MTLVAAVLGASFAASPACPPANLVPYPGTVALVHVAGGRFLVGKQEYLDNPARVVNLESFDIAAYDVTNLEFQKFVDATGYRSDAERLQNAMDFAPPMREFRWSPDKSAGWRFPNGIHRTGAEDIPAHPVTQISYTDAVAYCRWSGYRLPTLDEWEVASRAGATTKYFWGDDPSEIGVYANVWHGRDHMTADSSDGYMYTSPVGTFKPNPWGLYDIYGNVFQFCSGHLPSDRSTRIVHARGGSWWCSKNACCAFNSADIGRIDRHASFSNLGFRVVASQVR